jgi:uncharacterized protein
MEPTQPFQSQPGDDFRAQPGVPLVDPNVSAADRSYAMWIHLGTLIASVAGMASVGGGFFLPLAVALILWLIRKNESPFIDDHGREAVNFQLSWMLLLIIFLVLTVVVGILTCGIGFFILPLVTIGMLALNIVGLVLAAMAAYRGEYFRYPACIRFIS